MNDVRDVLAAEDGEVSFEVGVLLFGSHLPTPVILQLLGQMNDLPSLLSYPDFVPLGFLLELYRQPVDLSLLLLIFHFIHDKLSIFILANILCFLELRHQRLRLIVIQALCSLQHADAVQSSLILVCETLEVRLLHFDRVLEGGDLVLEALNLGVLHVLVPAIL